MKPNYRNFALWVIIFLLVVALVMLFTALAMAVLWWQSSRSREELQAQVLLQPFEEQVTHAARTCLQPEPSDAGPANAEQLDCQKGVGPKLRTSDVECLFEGFVGAEFSHGRCCR